jgi:hypothetical protein
LNKSAPLFIADNTMAAQTTIKLEGLDEVTKRLKVLGDRAPDGLGKVLHRFCQERVVFPAQNAFVPVVTGNLKASIRAEQPTVNGSSVSVDVVAGGPSAKYAARVHENPRAGKTQGMSPSGKKYYPRPGVPVPYSTVGQWKYLETPALEAAKSAAQTLGPMTAAVLKELGGA